MSILTAKKGYVQIPNNFGNVEKNNFLNVEK
jgi:hypothetical protein